MQVGEGEYPAVVAVAEGESHGIGTERHDPGHRDISRYLPCALDAASLPARGAGTAPAQHSIRQLGGGSIRPFHVQYL